MSEATLSQVFGANSLQNINSVTISKADLVSVGLEPDENNSAESLLVALILLCSRELTETNRSVDLDNRSMSVVYAGQDLVSQSGRIFRRDAFSVLLYKTSAYTPVSPSDY